MIQLFEISEDGSYVFPHSSLMGIKQFSRIIKRDRGSEGDSQGRKKLRAAAELAYVYHMSDPLSPYSQYSDVEDKNGVNQRSDKIIASFLPEGWEPDDLIEEAIEAYKELKITPSGRLLEGALTGAHKLIAFLKDVDLLATDDNGKPIYKPSDIMTPLKDMGKVVDTIQNLQEKVKSEQQSSGANKSNVEVNKYSE